MTLDAFLFQALNGLSSASGLFLVAAGLSLIFGVTRIVNLAHGSLYMLGTYIAYSFATQIGGVFGFWGGIVATALIVGAIGAGIEIVLLRRIYRAPELFQLLATFALVLVINDAALWLWGPEDLLGPRAPGLRGAVEILGRKLPSYDLFLIAAGPLVLLALHFALARTRFGRLVRAATQDREMVGALGVNQAVLFTAVFALGAALAGLGGALQVAREPANLAMDLTAIGDAFVVVVVGGMGSITGAYLAAVIIAEVKAICIGLGVVDFGFIAINFSKFTLVAEFLVMALVLIARPYGLLGRAQAAVRSIAEPEDPIRPATPMLKGLGAAVLLLLLFLPWLAQMPAYGSPFFLVFGIDMLIAVIFAASLHFIMGPGGMHSFGHAAYFGLGAYGAALLVKSLGAPMGVALVAAPLVALAGALLFGWFAVRLSGVYLAMLTLAFAQIVWAAVFQWETFTGGSNGVIGVWPPPPFDKAWVYYLLTLLLAVIAVLLLRRFLFAPFGYAMRAGRDSSLRAEAVGIDVKRVHWFGFAIAGCVCGIAGGLFAFAKGSISPETIHLNRSIDGLVMVLLGGVQTLTGPIVGASLFTALQDLVTRQTEYWRALLGGIILLLVLAFPQGIVGAFDALWRKVGGRS
jgi:branched-chain amino acid transport system permease protein